MIEKNQEFEVEIVGLAGEGQGVARIDGFVVFVPFALLGEIVKIHIIKVTKSYGVGKLIEVISPPKNRCKANCPYFTKCGGCSLQNISYQCQLETKKRIVQDSLRRIGGFENICVSDIEPSPNQFEYRNKSAFPLFVLPSGELKISMYRGQSHNPVFIDECKITCDRNMKIALAFADVVNTFFNTTKKEFLHLVVRTINDKSLITIVTKKHIKNGKMIFDGIKNKVGLKNNQLGVFECLKTSDNNVILDGEIKWLEGISSIDFEIDSIKMSVSPASFFQVNFDVMKKIYEKVNSIVKGEVVVDAYSGAGLMSAMLSKSAKQVYAIEIVEDATKDANRLKELNCINNLVNINGDTSKILPTIAGQLKKYSLVLDPPRKGVDEDALRCICENKPNQIVYVSCNPATLARDLKVICSAGYIIEQVLPYDMFPQTSHIETVVSLKNVDL